MKNDPIEIQDKRRKDCSISRETGLFSPSQTRIGSVPYVLPGWLGDPCLPGVVYRKTLNLDKKFQFIGNFKATQCFVTIVEMHFQWLEFHIRIHGVAGK